ncbi:hypothetical protein C8Q74DRAFT_334932 [Fomes fomentarius]|nr:hypothetical protein C8Q74DRAFT_334932 [Fomes fomentarius]
MIGIAATVTAFTLALLALLAIWVRRDRTLAVDKEAPPGTEDPSPVNCRDRIHRLQRHRWHLMTNLCLRGIATSPVLRCSRRLHIPLPPRSHLMQRVTHCLTLCTTRTHQPETRVDERVLLCSLRHSHQENRTWMGIRMYQKLNIYPPICACQNRSGGELRPMEG